VKESVSRERDLGEEDRELSLALTQRAPDGPADKVLASACFAHGLPDLGLEFAVRSAAAFRARGDATEADRVLAAAEAHTSRMTPRALAALARARVSVGRLDAAAEGLVAAAERSRNEGCVEEALELCHAAARWHPQVQGVHRTWSLTLLAAGDPDGALGHLARWGQEREGAWERMHADLESAYGSKCAGELVARARRAAGTADARGPVRGCGLRTRAFLAPGLAARRGQLVRVLTEADIDVVEASCDGGISEELLRALPLDLLIVPISRDRCPPQEWFRSLRGRPGLEELPILGVLAGEIDVDRLETLRMFGLDGVIDLGAAAEQIMFRIERVLRRAGAERRVHTRIPVSFDVAVDVNGVVTTERADSLSSGGMRLRSSRALEINREIRLRFRPEPELASIRANARVVNYTPPPAGGGGHAIGVFFLDLSTADRTRLDALVAERLIASSGLGRPLPVTDPPNP